MKSTLLTTFVFLSLFFYNANAQEASLPIGSPIEVTQPAKEKITGSFEWNYLHHYIWRGASFGNNDVAQPELSLGYKNISLTLAQNFNYRPSLVPKSYYTRNAFFDEQDVEINWEKEFGSVTTSFSALAYFYFYQKESPNTAELYNQTSWELKKGFSIFTENSVDVASYVGAIYSNNGVKFAHEFYKGISLETQLYAGIANAKFNDVYFDVDHASLNLLGANLEIAKEFKQYFVKAGGELNHYMTQPIKSSTGIRGTYNFYVGVGINF